METSARKNGQPVCDKPLVEVKDVSFAYDGKPILRDISFEICDIPDHGQVVGILGPSGVGKSTLISLLVGELEPDTGSVSIFDNDGKKAVPVRQGMVGKVAQNFWFFPHYTVYENLMIAVSMKNNSNPSEQKDHVEKILVRFGMADHRHKYRSQLSGGQQQRVAAMRQLLCSDHYTVWDEPFANLDPLMKDDLADLIVESADADELNTMIIVAHDMAQLLSCADRLILVGPERNPEDDSILPGGSTIVKTYDLVAMGLAYHPDISLTDEYHEMLNVLKKDLRKLRVRF